MTHLNDTIQLEMARGDTPVWEITVLDRATGLPVNIATYSIWLTAKRSKADADPGVFQLSTTNLRITITDAPNGKAQAIPATTDTSSLTEDTNLYWDVQIRSASGRTTTILEGVLTVSLDVTRA